MSPLQLWSCRIRTGGREHTRQVVASPERLIDGGLTAAVAAAIKVPPGDVEVITAVEIPTGTIPLLVVADPPPPVSLWAPEATWPDDRAWLLRLRKLSYDARSRARKAQPPDRDTADKLQARLDLIKVRLNSPGGAG